MFVLVCFTSREYACKILNDAAFAFENTKCFSSASRNFREEGEGTKRNMSKTTHSGAIFNCLWLIQAQVRFGFLFWISSDVSSGFQDKSGFYLISIVIGECNAHSLGSPSAATPSDHFDNDEPLPPLPGSVTALRLNALKHLSPFSLSLSENSHKILDPHLSW